MHQGSVVNEHRIIALAQGFDVEELSDTRQKGVKWHFRRDLAVVANKQTETLP